LVPSEIAFASHKQIDFNERTRTADAAHRTQQTTIATTSLIDSALATISQAIVNRLRKKKADVSPAAMVSATLTPSPHRSGRTKLLTDPFRDMQCVSRTLVPTQLDSAFDDGNVEGCAF
jgi:D-arabinose 5-phosphate isomerase GutQ